MHCPFGHTEYFRKFPFADFARGVQPSSRLHVVLCELRGWVATAMPDSIFAISVISVRFLRTEKVMRWILAGGIVACVTNLHAIWDRAESYLIGKPVGVDVVR